MSNYKIDLHTHSILSKDGSITKESYQKVLKEGKLDFIAITDHNHTDFAKKLNDEIGDKIIVGEEIMTKQGEIIGLFLKEKIQPDLSARKTINEIKSQDGLVMLPHPFDLKRHSLSKEVVEEIINEIDVFEVFNSRNIFRKTNRKALEYAKKHNLLKVANSDAHTVRELGKTYTVVKAIPNKVNLKKLLSQAEYQKKYVSIFNLFSPTINKIKKRIS